jgi:hypothetical protein
MSGMGRSFQCFVNCLEADDLMRETLKMDVFMRRCANRFFI